MVLFEHCLLPLLISYISPQYSDPIDKSHNRMLDKIGQWNEEDLKTFGKLTSATPKATNDKKPWKF